jgi:hypothetical protein
MRPTRDQNPSPQEGRQNSSALFTSALFTSALLTSALFTSALFT